MPKSKMWPYPLEPGTHVVARVRRLDLAGDEEIVGTIVRVIRPRTTRRASVSYAIRIDGDAVVETLASRTTPIDTSTPEGLDRWLDALDGPKPDFDQLPMPGEPSNEQPDAWSTANDRWQHGVQNPNHLHTILFNGLPATNSANYFSIDTRPNT